MAKFAREPIQFVAMSILVKTCLLLIIVSAVAAQQITQQPAQRPRRVNGGEQTTEAKKPSTSSEEVDEGDVVRVDTQLVSVPTVVTDGSGRPISGLRPENFRLIEDGQPQTVLSKRCVLVIALELSLSTLRKQSTSQSPRSKC